MGFLEEKLKLGGLLGSPSLLEEMKEMQDRSGMKKQLNSELWHACAGPLVILPQVGSLVYYFPQGHSEQVAVSTNRAATSQVPNYPNLSSQLLCQVQNITLHADKESEEVYAQMSLLPVNSEKDVLHLPNFGLLKPSKHPNEFFCKTLTASDTSTHGGFSVPRRAAEKLFPQLDYSLQPPTQELIVRDLQDNSWTFRHIYRGQPKRHLLTTGWSIFVGAKRLRAGDTVLFIRDEKSQLLVGVRRANRQQVTLPSSVLSADSMHIGVLAAAAHASANRTPFTIFYNPRSCPSDFVIPLAKYRKAIYGTHLSVAMRFGMMFETDESGKRRNMGTIVGMSDLDPLRWPGSKWRCLQVEWDEPGCVDKKNRVNPWEIETPESLFMFPSLTTGFKRPFQSAFLGAHSEWGNLINRPFIQGPGNIEEGLHSPSISNMWSEQLMKMLTNPVKVNLPQEQQSGVILPEQTLDNITNLPKLEVEFAANEISPCPPTGQCNEERVCTNPINTLGFTNGYQMESSFQYPNHNDLVEFTRAPGSSSMFGNLENHVLPMWDNSNKYLSQQNVPNHHLISNSFGLKDVLDDSSNQSDIYSGSTVVDPSASSTILDDFGTLKNVDFQNPSEYLVGSFSSQDVQSTRDSQAYALQEFADNSGGASSSNVELSENNISWQQVIPRVRTYTKIQKAGSVGRSIDVSSFKNYEEVCSAIERMFGLEGLLNDSKDSGWKLVYVDFENDVLLVGDDPWEEFVSCVRCIRILSPSEVQQMGEEGMQLLNSAAAQVSNHPLT